MSTNPKPETSKKRRLRIANKRIFLAKIVLSNKTTERALDEALKVMKNARE